jgi:regulatory protein
MPIITQLKIQKHDKERVSVFLDGEYAFSVSILAASALRREQTLTAEEITDLRRAGEAHLAYQKALRYLSYRPRSVAEVQRNLSEKDVDESTIAEVVNRLLDQGFLDDEAFARFWIENREQFRPRGRRALAYELRQKGLSNRDIDAALEPLDEAESAWSAISNKVSQWENLAEFDFRKKVMGYLSRRGFPYAICREAADRAWLELHEND